MGVQKEVAKRYSLLKRNMDELLTRRWAGAEALAIERGGISIVAQATGLSRTTVRAGRDELQGKKKARGEPVKVRRKGAGRPRAERKQPGLMAALDELVDPTTRGDPESPLRWTCKSTRALSSELAKQGFKASPQKVGALLGELGYSLQGMAKTLEGTSHPARDAQFKHINAEVRGYQERGQPVISVDTKKKELVGDFKNGGKEWQPTGLPEQALTHDFPQDALGKAIPYGVYDVTANAGWVSVGVDHDTPVFAVSAIEAWWNKMGKAQYPEASELLITADAGGSNSYRSRVFKFELQRLANAIGITIAVSHFPPGTSKWNKIEHRLFSHISMNWRGRPLENFETVVNLIGATSTRKGLRVKARLDKGSYPTGQTVSDDDMKKLNIVRSNFQGEWNYKVSPV
jgi:hypothetical protein